MRPALFRDKAFNLFGFYERDVLTGLFVSIKISIALDSCSGDNVNGVMILCRSINRRTGENSFDHREALGCRVEVFVCRLTFELSGRRR